MHSLSAPRRIGAEAVVFVSGTLGAAALILPLISLAHDRLGECPHFAAHLLFLAITLAFSALVLRISQCSLRRGRKVAGTALFFTTIGGAANGLTLHLVAYRGGAWPLAVMLGAIWGWIFGWILIPLLVAGRPATRLTSRSAGDYLAVRAGTWLAVVGALALWISSTQCRLVLDSVAASLACVTGLVLIVTGAVRLQLPRQWIARVLRRAEPGSAIMPRSELRLPEGTAADPSPPTAPTDRHAARFRHFCVALVVFSAGAFIGGFITHFAAMDVNTWPWFVGFRLTWQAGSACWCGWTAGRLQDGSVKSGLVWTLVFAVVGSLLCLNPLLDLSVRGGPVRLSGATVVECEHRVSRSGKGGPRLFVRVVLRTQDGTQLELKNSGYQASRWLQAIETCEQQGWRREQPVDLTLLVHMSTLLEFRCKSPDRPGVIELAPKPRAVELPRLTPLWRVAGKSTYDIVTHGRDTAPSQAFLLDPETGAPFAVELKTGRRRWTAKIDAAAVEKHDDRLPRFYSNNTPMCVDEQRIAVGEATVAVQNARRLTGYDARSGRRLWARDEGSCCLRDAANRRILLECNDQFEIVTEDTGESVVSLPSPSRSDQDSRLIGDTVVADTESHARLSLLPLTTARADWSIERRAAHQFTNIPQRWDYPLFPSSLLRRNAPFFPKRPLRGKYPSVLDADPALIWLGAPITAVDARTGAPLWIRTGDRVSSALFADGLVWLVDDHRLLGLDGVTGETIREVPLPDILVGRAARLAAAGSRFVLTAPLDSDAVLVTWTATAPKPIARRLPGGASTGVLVIGSDRILARTEAPEGLVAYSLQSTEPPLTSLTPEAAFSAVMDEGREDSLWELPSVVSYANALAQQPRHPRYREALGVLARRGNEDSLPILLDRLSRVNDERERDLLLAALAAQDDRRATQALLAHAGAKSDIGQDPRGGPVSPASFYARWNLWRTGRTAPFCPEPATRFLPASAFAGGGTAIGTRDPMLVKRVAPDGRWVFLLQARDRGPIEQRTDRPYLVIGTGPGYPITELLDHDPSGRFVAVRDGMCLSLIDTRARTVTSLPGADLRNKAQTEGEESRPVSFDASGHRMLYLRGGAPHNAIVIRELGTGQETTLEVPGRNVWNASLDVAGDFIEVESEAVPSRPVYSASSRARELMIIRAAGLGRLDRAIVGANGGTEVTLPGLLRPFGKNLLVREQDDTVAELTSTGTLLRVLAPADCHATLLHADPVRGLILVACRTLDGADPVLWLYGPTPPIRLGATRHETAKWVLPDNWSGSLPRGLELAYDLAVDFEHLRLVKTLEPGPAEVAHESISPCSGVYARRGDGMELWAESPCEYPFDEHRLGPLRWRRASDLDPPE